MLLVDSDRLHLDATDGLTLSTLFALSPVSATCPWLGFLVFRAMESAFGPGDLSALRLRPAIDQTHGNMLPNQASIRSCSSSGFVKSQYLGASNSHWESSADTIAQGETRDRKPGIVSEYRLNRLAV